MSKARPKIHLGTGVVASQSNMNANQKPRRSGRSLRLEAPNHSYEWKSRESKLHTAPQSSDEVRHVHQQIRPTGVGDRHLLDGMADDRDPMGSRTIPTPIPASTANTPRVR